MRVLNSEITYAEEELRCCEFCKWFRMEDEAYGEGMCRRQQMDTNVTLVCGLFVAKK